MKPRRLFIAGATGAVGSTLLRIASTRSLDVVPHVRPKSAASVDHPAKRVLELADPALPDAMSGCTTVVQLIGTMRKRFSSGDTYESSDIGTTRLLVDAAKKAGIDHLVLLSSAGAGRPIGAYLKAKAAAEALVRDSGIPFTIFRPSAFEDREGAFVPGLRAVTTILGLDAYRPITLAELASAIAKASIDRAPLDAVLEGKPLWTVVEAARGLTAGSPH